MLDQDDDTTIGRGGWALVVASGLIFYVVLRHILHYLLFPSLAFALAIALIVLLILYRLAVAVNRHDDAEAERHVRRIVPASAVAEGSTRVSGIEGAQASTVVAVPVRPDPATPVPQRPVATVTPLAKVEPAPLILPQQAEATPAPAARTAQPTPVDPVEEVLPEASAPVSPEVPPSQPAVRTAAKPKAEAKTGAKSGSKSVAGGKSAARAATKVATPAPATSKPTAGFKGKAELQAKAAEPVDAAVREGTTRTKAASKAKAGPKSKAAKAPASGLVRLSAPRGGKADDLKLIDGVGPALERLMNSLGFYHFDQIAAWTEADVALVDAEMKSFKGRATRDKWVLQAKILANGGTKEEAAAAKA
ncbi:MAG: hypothetical protein ACK4FR_03735 [Tabrizicola sp.]